MFRIENLLNLFHDDVEVKRIILSAYEVSQKENKELSDIVFEQLLFLKSINPNLHIKVNYDSSDNSKCSIGTNAIHLNGFFDETTFFHELTHLFSYYYSKLEIPQAYIYYKKIFLSDLKNTSNVISFLNFCEEEKLKFLIESLTLEKEKNKNNENLINNCLGRNDFLEPNHDYLIICRIEDIIDSIYGGKSSDYGLTYVKDRNTLPTKSSKSAGHGCDYFNKTGYEFEEIIADYQALNLIAPNNQFFILLKQILGDEFISFLDDRCQLINGGQPKEVNLNSIIRK